MYDPELERFKRDVHLLRYAVEQHGYQRNKVKSTRTSHVLGHPTTGDKIVAKRTPEGHWIYFSVRDERDNGTVIDFILHRTGGSFGQVRKELRIWLGSARPVCEDWTKLAQPPPAPDPAAVERVFLAARLAPTSVYLESRGLRRETLALPRFADCWRIGPRDEVLFPHRDDTDTLTGFEIKNRGFTGFSTGGHKSLWQSHALPADRALVLAESAIDALSYHALHPDDGVAWRYLSTGGAPSARQWRILEQVFSELPSGCTVLAAVDRDDAGDQFADRYARLAGAYHLTFRRDSPADAKDWNDVLQRARGRSHTESRDR